MCVDSGPRSVAGLGLEGSGQSGHQEGGGLARVSAAASVKPLGVRSLRRAGFLFIFWKQKCALLPAHLAGAGKRFWKALPNTSWSSLRLCAVPPARNAFLFFRTANQPSWKQFIGSRDRGLQGQNRAFLTDVLRDVG